MKSEAVYARVKELSFLNFIWSEEVALSILFQIRDMRLFLEESNVGGREPDWCHSPN
jgi:hypothetical protein